MSDYYSPNDPFDPLRRFDPDARANRGDLITGAVFLVVALVVVLGIYYRGHVGTNTASNIVMPPPAVNQMSPPATTPAPPTTLAPNTPAQQGRSR